MRVNLRYVLILLCGIFGTLYVAAFSDQLHFLNEFRDLTANLLGALVVILVIDRIVKKSELQRTTRSINYVRRRIASVLIDLIWRLRPSRDRQERLEVTNANWDDYYDAVWNIKENTLHSLETVLDRYHYLIDDDLKNDVIEMVGLLEDPIRWARANPNIAIGRDSLGLYSIAGDVTNVISQAINVIKLHKLLEDSEYRVITSRPGEPPRMTRKKLTDADRQIRRHYSYFEKFRKESIEFRDKCYPCH